MKYTHILFDLDGTISDSKEGIIKSFAFALEHFGIGVAELEDLTQFIGPPLFDSFKGYYGFTDGDAQKAVNIYRERYIQLGMYENKPYEGIEQLLKQLKDSGKYIMLATSKLEFFTLKILEHFDFLKYFEYVSATSLNNSLSSKSDIIRNALCHCEEHELSRFVMIGDRKYDIAGAHDNGINAIGVLYGYGSRQELEAAGADYIVERVADLSNILI